MGVRNQPMTGVPNASWNEPRIFDGVDRNKLSRNWSEIQENDRLVSAYVEKHGIEWTGLTYEERYNLRDEIIEKAKSEGL